MEKYVNNFLNNEKVRQLMDEHAFEIHEVYHSGRLKRSFVDLFECIHLDGVKLISTPYTTILGDTIKWDQNGWVINDREIIG